jgi:hypothetical protein
MTRDADLSDAPSMSSGDANFRSRYGSIGAVAGQDARMSQLHGCSGVTLTRSSVGLRIRRAPARVAGQ